MQEKSLPFDLLYEFILLCLVSSDESLPLFFPFFPFYTCSLAQFLHGHHSNVGKQRPKIDAPSPDPFFAPHIFNSQLWIPQNQLQSTPEMEIISPLPSPLPHNPILP